jgi:small nuclear ribonucleoprotein (snRNP)-like protein
MRESNSLCLFSIDFDALKALYAPLEDILVPDIEAPIFDNLQKWQSVIIHGKPIEATPSLKRLNPYLLQQATKKRKIREDLLEFKPSPYNIIYFCARTMRNYSTGPLSFLTRAISSSSYITIILRYKPIDLVLQSKPTILLNDPEVRCIQDHTISYFQNTYYSIFPTDSQLKAYYTSKYILGFIIGQIDQFDKHLNLQLRHVLQCFTHNSFLKSQGILYPRSRSRKKKHHQTTNLYEKCFWKFYPCLFVRGADIITIK